MFLAESAAGLKILSFVVAAITLVSCTTAVISTGVEVPGSDTQIKSENPALEKVSDVPESDRPFSVKFISSKVGWLANDRNLWKTVDGGVSWDQIYSIKRADNLPSHLPASQLSEYAQAFNSIVGPYPLTESLGILRTSNGLFKTEDAGGTWTEVPTPLDYPSGELRDMLFLGDGSTGWISGGVYRTIPRLSDAGKAYPNDSIKSIPGGGYAVLEGTIYRTDNGGKTWQKQDTLSSRVLDINFTDTDHGIAVADSGIFYTNTGGREWRRAEIKEDCEERRSVERTELRPIALVATDDSSARVLFSDGVTGISSDGGKKWCLRRPHTAENGEQKGNFKAMHFIDSLHGWALNADGSLQQTADGGLTWTRLGKGLFDSMSFFTPSQGFVVGTDGLFRLPS